MCLILKFPNHSIHSVKAQILSPPSYTNENLWLRTERLRKKRIFSNENICLNLLTHTLMIWNILSVGNSLLYFSLLSFKAIKQHVNKLIFLLPLGPHFHFPSMFEGMLYIPLGMFLQPGVIVFYCSDRRITMWFSSFATGNQDGKKRVSIH